MLFEAEGQWTPWLTETCIAPSKERELKAGLYKIQLFLMDFGLLLLEK